MKPNSGTGRCVVLATLAILLLGRAANAEISIDITEGTAEPLPIAIPVFSEKGNTGGKYGKQLADVVSADLERSGIFRPLDRAAFLQKLSSPGIQPRFGEWRTINAHALVVGGTEVGADGRLRVEFRLWDVLSGEQMAGLRYVSSPKHWRRVAHIIADKVYQRITGESGYFDTRVVYVSESGSAKKRTKRLAIMDQDGANHRFLTGPDTLVLTPRFSPTEEEITFLSYIGNRPRVYLYNVDTGQQEVLGDFPGMTFAPRFSFDGDNVIMSMADDGNSEIYTMDLRTRRVTRLTRNPAIDTSPSYSPDGKRIVFNSTRGGSQQIYVMNADGTGVRRISFGAGRYATPVWVSARRPDCLYPDQGQVFRDRGHAAGWIR